MDKKYTDHLQPIVDYLVSIGNVIKYDATRSFRSTKHGYECSMSKEVNWGDLEARFDLPSTITIDRCHGVLRNELNAFDIIGGSD